MSRRSLQHVVVVVALVVTIVCGACAGAQFELAPDLRAASTAPVVGERPMCTGRAGELEKTGVESVAAGTRVAVGDLTLALSRPTLARQSVRPDPQELLDVLAQLEGALGEGTALIQTARTVAARVGDVDPRVDERLAPVTGGLGNAATVLKDAQQLVDWLQAWLTLPTRVTQLATLAMVARQGDAHVYVVCGSTNAVEPGQTFTPSQFRLSCRLMPETGGVPWDLEMSADGSGWVDYRYHGALTRAGAPGWTVRSQSMQALGAGHFRGFEVLRGERQDAAISFWEDGTWDSDASTTRYSPRAWWRPQSTPEETRVLQLMTGLLHAYPFPGVCDAAIINDRTLAPLQ